MFKITLESVNGSVVCHPVGDLDSPNVSQLRAAFSALAQPGHVVIDLTEVPFVDSAGLGALVGGVRRVREAGGTVAVFPGRHSVARVLRMVGFDKIVQLTSSLAEALEDGAPHAPFDATPVASPIGAAAR